jgi:hypothetical protein
MKESNYRIIGNISKVIGKKFLKRSFTGVTVTLNASSDSS